MEVNETKVRTPCELTRVRLMFVRYTYRTERVIAVRRGTSAPVRRSVYWWVGWRYMNALKGKLNEWRVDEIRIGLGNITNEGVNNQWSWAKVTRLHRSFVCRVWANIKLKNTNVGESNADRSINENWLSWMNDEKCRCADYMWGTI